MIKYLLQSNPKYQELKSKPVNVILVSSLPRSGSTLLSQLLYSRPESIYYFEPLRLENTTCKKSSDCVARYFHNLLTCSYKENVNLTKLNIVAKRVKECQKFGNKVFLWSSCISHFNLTKICVESKYRILKTIRADISFLENLLKDEENNFKLVHLVRDPRGSLMSIAQFNWDKDPYNRCSTLHKDIINFNKLHLLYPTKVIQIRYEDLCLDPFRSLKKLIKFLYNEENINKGEINYINQHFFPPPDEIKLKSALDTKRIAKIQYHRWRTAITPDVLDYLQAEEKCTECLKLLGYRYFENFEDAINLNISLFSDVSHKDKK